MDFVVAFDASPIACSALGRAETLAAAVGGSVTTVTVIPRNNPTYARNRGWIGPEEAFSTESIRETVEERVASIAPGADVRTRTVERYAPRGKIGRVLRTTVATIPTDVLVIGSRNVGRVFTAATTASGAVAEGAYDVFVVRSVDPACRSGAFDTPK
ncbi:MAG: universal stress protein [Halanaeroarchaeum sp.]